MTRVQEIYQGLLILDKYEGNDIAVEHYILYAGPSDAKSVSEEDNVKLEELGWHIDSETGSWARFV